MSKQDVSHEVQTMLKSYYIDDPVLTYEDTLENQVILRELLKSLKESEKISNMYLQDLNSKTEEFINRTEKMRICFESAYLDPSPLGNASQSTLRNLASCACILNLKDLSDTSYLLAMTRLTKDQLTVGNDIKKAKLLHTKINDSIEALMVRIDCLQNKLYLIGDQPQKMAEDMGKLEKAAQVLDKKKCSLLADIAFKESQLQCVGLEPTLLHGTLVKQSQKLRDMERKCDILSMKLGRFQGLPANRDLAIAEVEKLKEEIRGLDIKLYTAASKNQVNF